MFLKVSPWKGVIRFSKTGNLAPRQIEPYEIISKVGLVAYRLKLPQELSTIHDVFHVSNLKKCLTDETVIVPLEDVQVNYKLNFVDELVEIAYGKTKQLRHDKISLVKVRWNSQRGPVYILGNEMINFERNTHTFSLKINPLVHRILGMKFLNKWRM